MNRFRPAHARGLALAVSVLLLLISVGCDSAAEEGQPDAIVDEALPDTETPPPTETATDEPEPPVAEEPASDLPLSGSGADLWPMLSSGFYRTEWDKAPGYETRQPAVGPHGDEVEIFISPVMSDAAAQGGLDSWPNGSSVVKDAYAGGQLVFVAVMQKRGDVWYWAEYHPDGSIVAEGLDTPSCADCHSEGEDYVRAFGLP